MSANAVLHQETYEVTDAAAVAQVHDFMAARAAAGRGDIAARYFLAGAAAGDQVELPEEVHRILLQVVEALQRGLAVTISPQSRTLTTQQAAALLNVSRPTVVKLLDKGEMPYERVGTHRRVRLADLLAYREARKTAQYDALAALYPDDYAEQDAENTLSELREARRAVRESRMAHR